MVVTFASEARGVVVMVVVVVVIGRKRKSTI